MTPVISLEKDCIMVKLTKDVLEHCQKFTCGEEDLDDFFANDAIAYAKDLMGKTYCWLLKNDDTNRSDGDTGKCWYSDNPFAQQPQKET